MARPSPGQDPKREWLGARLGRDAAMQLGSYFAGAPGLLGEFTRDSRDALYEVVKREGRKIHVFETDHCVTDGSIRTRTSCCSLSIPVAVSNATPTRLGAGRLQRQYTAIRDTNGDAEKTTRPGNVIDVLNIRSGLGNADATESLTGGDGHGAG